MDAQATQFHEGFSCCREAVFSYLDLASDSCAMPQLHVIESIVKHLFYVKNFHKTHLVAALWNLNL